MLKIALTLVIATTIVVSTMPAYAGDADTQAADNVVATSQSSVIKRKVLLPPTPAATLPVNH